MTMGKDRTLFFIVALAILSLNLVILGVSRAQTAQPSVPEFTVKYVDRSYTTPVVTTQSTDPFTGQQVTHTSGGQYVVNKTIDITIQNQLYTPTTLPNGTVIQLYYSIRMKGHFADWTPVADGGYSFRRVLASTSDYTVATFTIGSSDNDILMGYANVIIPQGGQEDFQVSAQEGYLVPDYGGHIIPQPLGYDFISFGDSGWSSIQEYKIGNTATLTSTQQPAPTTNQPNFPTPSPAQNPTATVNLSSTQTGSHFTLDWEKTALIILVAAIAVMAVGMVVLWRRVSTKTPV